MKVQVDGKTYVFGFHYEELTEWVEVGPGQFDEAIWGKDTTCYIHEVLSTEPGTGKVTDSKEISFGLAEQSRQDQFEKRVGRYIAFKRAVAKLYDKEHPEVNLGLRTALWEKFRTTHQMPNA